MEPDSALALNSSMHRKSGVSMRRAIQLDRLLRTNKYKEDSSVKTAIERTHAIVLMASLALLAMAAPRRAFASPADDQKENDRIRNSGTVLKEILNVPDDIPRDLLAKARCVIVLPSVLKAAFIAGADYGRGVMTCRTGNDFNGPWGAPTMMALEGGSFGLQIGGQATDFVILVMNNRGAESLLHSKVKLGADASISAGPKGREVEADTDVTMRSEMLSYSRSRGVFAGISLEGTTLRPDNDANRRLYGKDVSATQVIRESKVEAPESAHTLIATLQQASPKLQGSNS